MAFKDEIHNIVAKTKSLGRLIQRFHIEDIEGDHLVENTVPYKSMMKDLDKIEQLKQTLEDMLENMYETHSEAVKDPANAEELETMLDELASIYSSFMKAYSSHCAAVRNNSRVPKCNEVVMNNQGNYDLVKTDEVIRDPEVSDSKTSSGLHESTSIPKDPKLHRKTYRKAKNMQDQKQLSQMIAKYCETGPFLTHQPQFIDMIKFTIHQYQKKLPMFGHLMKPVIVGGAIDETGGTLTAPDLDFSIQWELDEKLTSHLIIRPTDEGESGQYTLQVMKGHEHEYKSGFRPFVIDIQNHGRIDVAEYVHDKVDDAYVEIDSKTFLSSDLLRSQVGGLFDLLEEGSSFGYFTRKDFSQTGAARTMALDVNKFFRKTITKCLGEIPDIFLPLSLNRSLLSAFIDDSFFKFLPELEVDYTPVLTISYDQLPADLKIWEERDSWMLDHKTRMKIKEARGTLVAKSLEKDESRSSIIWRLSLNSAPVMERVITHFQGIKPKCSVKKVLRLIKDLKNVALDGTERDFLKSYNVKQAMLWCMEENPDISTEANLLMSTLIKLHQFYQQQFLPSFLEPKRNLIFKMSKTSKSEEAKNRVMEILTNVESYLPKIKDAQEKNRKGICEARNALAPIAHMLLVPMVSKKITVEFCKGLNRSFTTQDGKQRFYFEDTDRVGILVKGTKRAFSGSEGLKRVIHKWVDSISLYLTTQEDAFDLIPNSVAAVFKVNKENTEAIKQIVRPISVAIEEAFPGHRQHLPIVNNVFNTIVKDFRSVRNVHRSLNLKK